MNDKVKKELRKRLQAALNHPEVQIRMKGGKKVIGEERDQMLATMKIIEARTQWQNDDNDMFFFFDFKDKTYKCQYVTYNVVGISI